MADTQGISNRETATEEAKERKEFPPQDTGAPPPEDAAGRRDEEGGEEGGPSAGATGADPRDRQGGQTSLKAGNRSIAQKEAGSRYGEGAQPASNKVPGAFGKEKENEAQ
jgi:hypothetical protein